MGPNLLGLNMALLGQGARDGTGPQGGAVEPPIPRDIVMAMGKMARWMRAPPKNVLEIADPITKQTLRYLMGDLGLGPKIEKKTEGEKVGEKGKGKEGEGEKGKEADNGKGKEKEVEKEKMVEAVKEKGKEMEGEGRKEKEKDNVAVVQGDKETLEKVQGDDRVSGPKTVEAKEKESEKANDNAEGPGNVRAATPVPVIPRIPSDLPPTDEELARWLEGTYRNGTTPEKRKSPGLNSKAALVMAAFRPSNAVVSKKPDASATDTSTPSLDNQALATELPKASTPSPPSPSVASSMSISVSPATPSPRRDTEDELASSSTIPLLPALSSSADISSAAAAGSPKVSRPSSPSPSPPSESVISPIIPPPPIVTPTLVHPPIPTHVPASPLTHSPSSISVSATVSPISSTTWPSLKEKAMSTILSVLPSIAVPFRERLLWLMSCLRRYRQLSPLKLK
ncbi:hypothetical protein CPB84DRAFT_1538044 [Gymnopilus junonius]|uniref:Uncharacterized protein n=1 Tax=Gymnopilus junonius TaxID=109634 RepID=A0A9P5NGR8_GYMJU|nr:hypothetical protein CPB84DRAFT_1538044 [Gymnopilus junonius]